MPTNRLYACVIVAALALLSGCSAFDRDWKAATNAKPATPTDITGRWQGNWISDGSSHSGDLRCLITRVDHKTYHARYAATYWGILHFGYEMNLTAERQGEWIHFHGEADLGSLAGGMYQYEGHANAEDFYATYRADVDHGKFTMKRPQ